MTSRRRPATERSEAIIANARGHPWFRLAIYFTLALWVLPTAAAGQEPAATGRQVIAAVPASFPPEYSLDNAGRPRGFAIDVMDRIAELADLRVTYRVFDTWLATQDAVKSGQADLVPIMGITETRSKDFDFSRPLETLPVSIFVRTVSYDIGGLADLKGRAVAVVHSNAAVGILRGHPGIQLRIFSSLDEALFQLLSGEVDAVAYPEPALNRLARQSGLDDRIKVVGLPLTEIKRALAVRKGRLALVRQLDAAAQSFVGSKEYRDLYLKWYGKPMPYWSATRIAWSMGSAVLFVALFGIAWRFVSVHSLNRQLREQIKERDLAIAQRERFQTEMIASESKFSTLVDTPLQAVVVHRGGRPLFANQTFLEMFGYRDLEEALSDPAYDARVHPDDRPILLNYRAALTSGQEKSTRITFRVNRPDGTMVWVSGGAIRVQWGGESAVQVTMIDISEGVRATEELEKFFHVANEALLIVDGQGNVLRVNESFAKTMGYPAEALIGRFLFDLMVPEDRESAGAMMRSMQEEIDSPQLNGFELRFVQADGTLVWFSWNVAMQGDRVAYCSARNITEQKRTDEALRASQKMLQGVVNGLPLALFLVDMEDRSVIGTNASAAKMFGHAIDELLGHTTEQLHVDHEHYEAFRRSVYSALEQTGKWATELNMCRKDGSVFPTENHLTLLRSEDGKWKTIISLIADITDRKRAEADLAEREERFRAIIESSADVISLMDEGGKILLQSPSVQAVLGYAPTELVGRNAFELIHPEDQTATREVLGRAFAEPGTTQRVQMRIRHKDGSWRLMDSRGRSLVADAWRGNVVLNSRDITEQNLLEDQLRQSQKMEAVGLLAGGIAHDFNNLLSIILSYAELLQDELDEDDPGRKDTDHIIAAGRRAAGLTRQLLAFSRRQILKLEVLDLDVVVRGIEKMLVRLIGEDVELEVRIADGVHRLKADVGQMEQIVMNLAVNARDAMPTGGHLAIEIGNATLDEAYVQEHLGAIPGDYVTLAVTDNGAGMDAATHQHIFEPFFTTKEQGKGTGLGLATVYGIVKQLEGSIRVHSEIGVGTTFNIYLPVSQDSAQLPAAPAVVASPRGNEILLVVEDEEFVRAATCRMLRQEGYTVLEASNGDDALAMCAQPGTAINMLLTDVVMPRMSGRQLRDQLNAMMPGLRCMYMSGYTDDAIVRHGVLESDTELMQKPFSRQTLLESVRKVLDAPAAA